MHISKLANKDVSYIDAILLDASGRLKPVPSAVVAKIPFDDLRIWLHFKGVYGLPTTELIEYLKERIGDQDAIEIGAGNGVFGRVLGIPSTDSFIQARPDVHLYYAATGQPTVQYGTDVEQMDAEEAVKHFQPEVVFGSWITQLWQEGDESGSVFGIDEEALLNDVDEYILFGSFRNHGKKRIWPPGEIVQEPWMWSRAPDSVLFIWKQRKLPQEWSANLQDEGGYGDDDRWK